jgi:hypothetical protein
MAVQIIDYPSLLSAGADWLNRGDLVEQLPAFVTLTEAQFNRELRLRDMMVRADATSADENVALPDDWLEHYSLVVAPGGDTSIPPLRYMSEKESNQWKQGGLSGPPQGYTIIGNMIELVPAPGADLDLKMVYYARIPSLNATTQLSNWLLAKSPDLYLYSTLMQAAPYLKDDARFQAWSGIRGSLMEAMRVESEAAMRPRSQIVAMARAF